MKKYIVILTICLSSQCLIRSQNTIPVDTQLIKEWYKTIIDLRSCQSVNDTLHLTLDKDRSIIKLQFSQVNILRKDTSLLRQNIDLEHAKTLLITDELKISKKKLTLTRLSLAGTIVISVIIILLK